MVCPLVRKDLKAVSADAAPLFFFGGGGNGNILGVDGGDVALGTNATAPDVVVVDLEEEGDDVATIL